MGDRSAKSWLLPSCVTESKFADDAALYDSYRDGLEAVASSFVCVARGWGLTVSLVKSKGMAAGIGADTLVLALISVQGGVMDWWRVFNIWAASLVVMGTCMGSCLGG